MTDKERDDEVAAFIANIIQSLPPFFDKKIMDSFDVKFEYNKEHYQLALIKNGKVNGHDFELCLN